jgi:hypothetical protein
VIDTSADLFMAQGAQAHVRSEWAPAFEAAAAKLWIEGVRATTVYIGSASKAIDASPSNDGYIQSFQVKLRHELLEGKEVKHAVRSAGAH